MKPITGSIVALTTPMHTDGSVDYPTLRKLIDWHIAEGTDCIGVVNLLENDQQTLLNSGFEFESLEWPCKREVSVHVLFLEEELETIIKGVRKK